MNLNPVNSNLKNFVFSSNYRALLTKSSRPELFCFSHLRWDFVYQRPQHLMSRFANFYDVFYIEEPIYTEITTPSLSIGEARPNVYIIRPHLPKLLTQGEEIPIVQNLLEQFINQNNHTLDICWYYTPMMYSWANHSLAKVIVYDCMDELSAFKFAPKELGYYEERLMQHSDLVFTGGNSLYKAKNPKHSSVHLFPSSVDITHFKAARHSIECPDDQINIPLPRIGFYGVIDERFDIRLLEDLAQARKDWHFIIIGPVVKINPKDLPHYENIHYLGSKTYEELPAYLTGWDISFIPFAINESTRYISPTKTPEYLAAGKAVVSTPITDIVATYGHSELVQIADPKDINGFISAIERALKLSKDKKYVNDQADIILDNMSWDKTFNDMHELILERTYKNDNNH
ncbi:MAG: glycosyltransferase family 1 protein [Burkholderiales bacterium]|nr:glycosyltransferase family 1 protein [Burkholderiales bacterium]